MSNLPKRMLINARSSTTRNDSAKCGYPCIMESCRKTFNFHNKIPLCLVYIKNVELERKAEKFSRVLTNGAARRIHFILEQTAQLISEAVQLEH